MTRHLFFALILSLLPAIAQDAAKEPPPLYPFEVTLGGHKAAVKNHDDLFAVIGEPIKSDAVLSLAEKSDMIIINAFPCKEDGTVLMDQPALVIFAQSTKEVKMDETLDHKKLSPGTYLMNVVAHGKTSRVVFTVTDEKTKIKLPDLSKIVEFLKGK